MITFSYAILGVLSILITTLSVFTSLLKLYAWEDDLKHERGKAPETFAPPSLRFTLLLPLRHEEAVVQDTISSLVKIEYPRSLLQILIIIHENDIGTLRKAVEKLLQYPKSEVEHFRIIKFNSGPLNKPHSLNIGLNYANGDVIAVFDAEDEIHENLLKMISTVMTREDVSVIQSGVQLTNYDDHWFSPLCVMEYFFWFKSRIYFHASFGLISLAGNTFFINRDLFSQIIGWDESCLTEDAELGLRLTQLQVKTRVLYEELYVTREETPVSTRDFIRQRTRWNQGFLHLFLHGKWLSLQNWQQKAFAGFTFSYPLLQVFMVLYFIAVWLVTSEETPIFWVFLCTLPIYSLLIDLSIILVGLFEFAKPFNVRISPRLFLQTIFIFLPYQILLAYCAFRALWRYILGFDSWEKTEHVGAHRIQMFLEIE